MEIAQCLSYIIFGTLVSDAVEWRVVEFGRGQIILGHNSCHPRAKFMRIRPKDSTVALKQVRQAAIEEYK
jgi:hypothetical protein